MWGSGEVYRYRVLVGKTEGKRPLGRSRRRWEDLQKVGWDMDWIELARDSDRWHTLVYVLINLQIS